jgi:MoaA/NifB/PqqE/SkfB family radical SAM enzyme
VYRSHPLFTTLRDPDALRGPRCGRCPYRRICGGSRSRAYATSGDPLGDDPLCGYAPSAGGEARW